MKRTAVYPFTAIVGQEDMKLALILNVINPALGGVLIKGEKGTAKSTADLICGSFHFAQFLLKIINKLFSIISS